MGIQKVIHRLISRIIGLYGEFMGNFAVHVILWGFGDGPSFIKLSVTLWCGIYVRDFGNPIA